MTQTHLLGIRRLVHAGDRAREQERWAEATEAYDAAYRLLDALGKAQSSRVLFERVLGEVPDLGMHLAYARVRDGDMWGALVAIERGRTQLLSDALQRSALRAEMETDPRLLHVADRFSELATALSGLERIRDSGAADSPEGFGRALRETRREYESLVAAIADLSGLEHHRRPIGESQLRSAIAGRNVVYLGASSEQGFAIHHGSNDELRLAWLPDAPSAALRQCARRLFDATDHAGDDLERALEEIDAVCEWIGRAVSRPLARLVEPVGELGVVAASWFSVLPLQAGWETDSQSPPMRRFPLMGQRLIYLPSAQALRPSVASTQPRALAGEVLVVCPRSEAETDLPEAVAEGKAVSDRHPRSLVVFEKADVLEEMSRHGIVHFATHAVSHPGRPLASAVLTKGGWLSVSELLGAQLAPGTLCVLSACQTAAAGRTAPDEGTGLVSGLISAGSTAVVASLWPVEDLATRVFMSLFHEQLVTSVDWAQTLASAQTRLRTLRISDLAPADARLFGDVDASRHPFDHPFFWAAFTFTSTNLQRQSP